MKAQTNWLWILMGVIIFVAVVASLYILVTSVLPQIRSVIA